MVLSVITLSHLFPSSVFKKKEISLVIEMFCNNNIEFYATSNALTLKVVQLSI